MVKALTIQLQVGSKKKGHQDCEGIYPERLLALMVVEKYRKAP